MLRATLAACLALLSPVLSEARAQPADPADAAFDRIGAVHRIPEVAISSEGGRVAWIEDVRREGGRLESELYVAPAAGTGGPRRIRVGRDSTTIHHLTWSADGRLAFLSDADTPRQRQIYIVAPESDAARRLTRLKGELGRPRFSPDGRSIAFLFTENARAAAGPTAAKPAETGVIGQDHDVQRLAVADSRTGRVRTLRGEDLYVHEYDWAPDGRRIVATAGPTPGDDGWYVSELYVVDVATGKADSIVAPRTQIGGPRWSRDGSRIAYIAGLMSDEGPVGGDVFVVPAAGGEPRNLTGDRPSTASFVAWQPSSDQLLVAEYADGASGLALIDVASGRVATLWRGDERIGGATGNPGPTFSLAADGKTMALTRQSFTAPPEVWAGPINAWRQVSRANLDRPRLWGEGTSLRWKSDGLEVQGWLLAPREVVAGKRHPMIVDVHGGPASAWLPSWPGSARANTHSLTSQGYYVLLPNPRGSHGRGQAFTRGNVRDFGGGDLRDILAGVDEALRVAPIDPERIGITGGSYGGFMTMWAVTQTQRFRAAVAVAGIANWQSYWGENGIARWMLPYFGATVYDDPAVYAKSSPINFIKAARTPTLVLVGEGDIECPPPQSYEFWRALRTLGTKTELVVYAGEGHGLVRPESRRDEMRRTWSWFREHLGDGPR
jgi:dipeptidyl aminopeptidase/acylaminoacyl peptidase